MNYPDIGKLLFYVIKTDRPINILYSCGNIFQRTTKKESTLNIRTKTCPILIVGISKPSKIINVSPPRHYSLYTEMKLPWQPT